MAVECDAARNSLIEDFVHDLRQLNALERICSQRSAFRSLDSCAVDGAVSLRGEVSNLMAV